MNLKKFIGASSAILLAWLGATYLHQVPSERYPSQTRSSLQSSTGPKHSAHEIVASIESNSSDK
ncbi:hypothetical protein [Luteolibacter sp. AS25]|uniref:hypothetical protein n=1 Tax=Luteolibacter sp. AS25 TaxID=3135776 RepID=UPI00398B3EF0